MGSSIDVSDIDGFEAGVHDVKASFPRAVYSSASGVNSQHGFHRHRWAIHQKGELVIAGFDVTEADDSGRVACVIGFFGARLTFNSFTKVESIARLASLKPTFTKNPS